MKAIYFLLCYLWVGSALAAGTMIDLTHPFNEKTIYWPTNKGFTLHKVYAGTDRGYFYAGNTFEAPEHGGTHMDAPYHFSQNGWTIEKIPLEKLTGEACVVDLSATIKDADYVISEKDIVQWEAQHGKLDDNCIVLFYTGWEKFWANKEKYMGSDVDNLHFPGLGKEAAQYLVSKKIKGVGLDTPSLDAGIEKNFWAHRVLSAANIYGLENLMNISGLPPRGSKIIVAPMKIEGGTGAPVRVYVLK